ncbi:dTDP-4-dehydrorhamnose 3,5-epimerase [Xiashengella succiniciproducens]|uniref:dTDP-4-dehydrorhamnose 3,5-epimerase n=1 Tax=Xiashengella succiniciproducens TaxID=2949635 RepID=A0A9J6ZLK1_9BACT|nr:dTDP-4-dehydrorhamnose 3,5-epimerase [Alkaliflexus sp. Ai-910]URW78539.1 dTDP-4-dehydrorhamnose 3,5-epimerase [Alkaliflexus sp. Ai-910]HHU00927.1 dTDP-4-dehydrorhamnose 3,5-epimerase [Bacteroidales bacterium]
MKVEETNIPGLKIIRPKVFTDARGYFLELYNKPDYKALGIDCDFVQENLSSSVKNTIRGLHYQLAPHGQAKLVQVIRGKVMDVAVDLRDNSPTFGKHYAIELSEENKIQFFIPSGFAHGFVALSDEVIFYYKCSSVYNHEAERGINFNDPSLGINWQIDIRDAVVSPKDKTLPFFEEAEKNFSFYE